VFSPDVSSPDARRNSCSQGQVSISKITGAAGHPGRKSALCMRQTFGERPSSGLTPPE
jgi:hypothetical protein